MDLSGLESFSQPVPWVHLRTWFAYLSPRVVMSRQIIRQIIGEVFVKLSGTGGWCSEALHKQVLSWAQLGLWVFPVLWSSRRLVWPLHLVNLVPANIFFSFILCFPLYVSIWTSVSSPTLHDHVLCFCFPSQLARHLKSITWWSGQSSFWAPASQAGLITGHHPPSQTSWGAFSECSHLPRVASASGRLFAFTVLVSEGTQHGYCLSFAIEFLVHQKVLFCEVDISSTWQAFSSWPQLYVEGVYRGRELWGILAKSFTFLLFMLLSRILETFT